MKLVFRSIFLALVFFAIVVPAHAQRVNSVGAADPYLSYYTGLNYPPSCDNLGRQPTALQGVDTSKKTLVLIVGPAQSNGINTSPTAFTPTNASKIDNLNQCDGGIYPVASDPLLGVNCAAGATPAGCATPGCTTFCLGNVATRIADALITAGKFDRVIIAPIGVGSTSIAMWASGGVLSTPNNRLGVALKRLSAKGITTSTTGVTIASLSMIGETDSSLGTLQAAWVAAWNSTISAGSLATGVRFFVTKETLNGSVSAAVQAAQTATSPSGVINHAGTPQVWEGADADSLTGNICGASANLACRQSDGLHFTDAGLYTLSALTVTKMGLSGAPF